MISTFIYLSQTISKINQPARPLVYVKGDLIVVNLALPLFLLMAKPLDTICPVKLHCLQSAPSCSSNPTLISSTSLAQGQQFILWGLTNHLYLVQYHPIPLCYVRAPAQAAESLLLLDMQPALTHTEVLSLQLWGLE